MRRTSQSSSAVRGTPLSLRQQRSGIPVSSCKSTGKFPRTAMTTGGRKDTVTASGNRFGLPKYPRTSFSGRLSDVSVSTTKFPFSNNHGTASGQRSSIGVGRPVTTQDKRPLKDVTFKNKMIIDIVDFLTDAAYHTALDEKSLRQPSKKQFMSIFEFLVSRIDPTFKCPDRIEIEVPIILKELGYPFTIKKSTLQTISAEHSWPEVLGALHWLIETLNVVRKPSEQANCLVFGMFDEDGAGLKRALFEAIVMGIAEVKNNGGGISECDWEPLTEHMKGVYLEHSMNPEEEKSVNNQIQALNQEVMSLTDGSSNVQEHLETLSSLEGKMDSYDKWFPQQEEYHKSLQLEIRRWKECRKEYEADLEKLEAECAHKTEIISHQKCSAEEVRKIKAELDELERQFEAQETENEAKRSHSWEWEKKVKLLKQRIVASYGAFVRTAQPLITSLQPADQDWCSSINWKMSPLDPKFLDYHNEKTARYMNMLLVYCHDNLRKEDEAIMQLDKHLDTQRETKAALNEELRELERKIAAEERAKANLEEEFDIQDGKLQEELDILRAKHEQAKKSAHSTKEEKETLVSQLNNRYSMAMVNRVERAELMRKDLQAMILISLDLKEELANHKQTMLEKSWKLLDTIKAANQKATKVHEDHAKMMAEEDIHKILGVFH